MQTLSPPLSKEVTGHSKALFLEEEIPKAAGDLVDLLQALIPLPFKLEERDNSARSVPLVIVENSLVMTTFYSRLSTIVSQFTQL